MHSLGREPQERCSQTEIEPRRGDILRLQRELQLLAFVFLSPLRGWLIFLDAGSWGSRPQANYLSRLRRSVARTDIRSGEQHRRQVLIADS